MEDCECSKLLSIGDDDFDGRDKRYFELEGRDSEFDGRDLDPDDFDGKYVDLEGRYLETLMVEMIDI